MGQTIVEKIAQSHLAEGPKRPLRTGDFVSIRPHHVMTHDNTSAVMKKFQGIGAKKIHDPKQLVFALDHDIAGLDVSMDDSGFMCGVQSCTHGFEQLECFGSLVEGDIRLAGPVLRHQPIAPVALNASQL